MVPAKPARLSVNYHPSTHHSTTKRRSHSVSTFKRRLSIPKNINGITLGFGDRSVKLTNLRKLFWPQLGITKGDLLQYYIDVSNALLPHLRDRAMVMKRYPNGAAGDFFFMKQAPKPRPEWIEICSIEHSSGNVIDFPIVQDLPSLLWIVNLGCIWKMVFRLMTFASITFLHEFRSVAISGSRS
jgi:hypothetical protein